ncbi:MAG: permease [Methylobacter sp.]
MELFFAAIQSGFASVASYLAAHVLLCLVPAFFVAGGLSVLVPQSSIVRFLGPNAPKWIAYPAAASAGSLLAVCSCTVQPLFAGIYSRGAGLGPAVTFLFFAPAANILALSYTGVALGAEFAIARVTLSLAFGIGIGMIMAILFRSGELTRASNLPPMGNDEGISSRNVIFLLALIALLIAGTLKIDLLTTHLGTFGFASSAALPAQQLLDHLLPVDAIKGNEGLSLQGVVLIVLLILIGVAAIRGLGKADEGFNGLTRLSLGLIVVTLIFASLVIQATPEGLTVSLTGRTLAVAGVMAVIWLLARQFDAWDMQQWLWESWHFVCKIFPLLIIGVFLVGIIRLFIRPEWIQAIAGSNTILGNLSGVVFGVFMYFPTLVEVPVAKMFLSLGMHPGPLIAYLMADPELSLQSILITSAIIGKLKAWTYVGFVALFSVVSGLAYGAWTDGTPMASVVLVIACFVGLVIATFSFISKRQPSPAG